MFQWSLLSLTLFKYVGIYLIGLLSCGLYYEWGNNLQPMEQHEMCYDTSKYEAWVAHKHGEMRCFFEYREWPHKVKASNID